MRIFFAIPFFNDAELMTKTLESIAYQSYPNWEAVVMDDSINPAEAARANAAVEKLNDSRIRYLKNPQNLGMSKNMNQALTLGVQGGFDGINIVHADDILDPDYAKDMTKAMTEHPEADVLFCRTKIIDGNGDDAFSFPDWYKTLLLPPQTDGKIILTGAKGIETLIPGNFIFFTTLCFAGKKLGAERFQENLKMVPDLDITMRILLKGGTLVGLYSKPLYYYRRHENNSTNLYNKSLLRFREERDLYLNLAQRLEEKGWNRLATMARRLKIVKLNLIFNAAKSLVVFDFKSAWNFVSFYLHEV